MGLGHLTRRVQEGLIFPSGNAYGIPDLLPQDFEFPVGIPFTRYRGTRPEAERHLFLCHFYLYDYLFDSVWNIPHRALGHVKQYWGSLTPDFSVYRDWPVVMQQWSIYRSRWVGRFWQQAGVRVIPTVNWSTSESFAWCFLGIPQQQVVSIGTPRAKDPVAQRLFRAGFQAMIEVLKPSLVLVYGRLPFPCAVAVEYERDVLAMRWRIQPHRMSDSVRSY